jgi:hypothetical protein
LKPLLQAIIAKHRRARCQFVPDEIQERYEAGDVVDNSNDREDGYDVDYRENGHNRDVDDEDGDGDKNGGDGREEEEEEEEEEGMAVAVHRRKLISLIIGIRRLQTSSRATVIIRPEGSKTNYTFPKAIQENNRKGQDADLPGKSSIKEWPKRISSGGHSRNSE